MRIIGILVGAFLVLGFAFIQPANNIKNQANLCQQLRPGSIDCPVDWSPALIGGGLVLVVAVSAYLILRTTRTSDTRRDRRHVT